MKRQHDSDTARLPQTGCIRSRTTHIIFPIWEKIIIDLY